MKTQLQPSSIKIQIVEDKSLLNERCDAFEISDSIERHFDSSYDEKEENFQMLNSCLIEEKEIALAENLDNTNRICRQRIAQAFSKLRRCSIQGDLNKTNLLCEDGHFDGKIGQ